jgi:hypothetical protein
MSAEFELSRRDRLTVQRRRRRRRNVWFGLVLIGMSCTLALVAGYVGRHPSQKRNAMINAQVCQPADQGRTFPACTLDVTYTDPSGRVGTAHLTGVAPNLIHDHSVDVYFSEATSDPSINREQPVPASTFVVLIACVWLIIGAIALIVAVVSRRTTRT